MNRTPVRTSWRPRRTGPTRRIPNPTPDRSPVRVQGTTGRSTNRHVATNSTQSGNTGNSIVSWTHNTSHISSRITSGDVSNTRIGTHRTANWPIASSARNSKSVVQLPPRTNNGRTTRHPGTAGPKIPGRHNSSRSSTVITFASVSPTNRAGKSPAHQSARRRRNSNPPVLPAPVANWRSVATTIRIGATRSPSSNQNLVVDRVSNGSRVAIATSPGRTSSKSPGRNIQTITNLTTTTTRRLPATLTTTNGNRSPSRRSTGRRSNH